VCALYFRESSHRAADLAAAALFLSAYWSINYLISHLADFIKRAAGSNECSLAATFSLAQFIIVGGSSSFSTRKALRRDISHSYLAADIHLVHFIEHTHAFLHLSRPFLMCKCSTVGLAQNSAIKCF